MKRSELLELIAGGENSGVEFKRDDLRSEQLVREVVALELSRGARPSRRGSRGWVMNSVDPMITRKFR